jgi:ABC-type sugar transport system substrate-binding protein
MIGRLRSLSVRIGVVVLGAMMGATWTGCGTDDLVPPPPSEVRTSASPETAGVTNATPAPATEPSGTAGTVQRIDWIASQKNDPDVAAVANSAIRMQAGYERARIRIFPDEVSASTETGPERNKSQAELVREALARKAQAVIVDPDDPTDQALARAVKEVREAKVPVIVLGQPIAEVDMSSGAAPMVVVTSEPFLPSARRLVELCMRNAKNAKLKPEAGAILLVTTSSDRLFPERLAALREALKAAKIARVDEVQIPKDLEPAADILKKRLQADPKLDMVLFVDLAGLTISNNVASDISDVRPFIQAGYTSEDHFHRMAVAGEFAALAEYMPNRLLKKAVTVAVAAAQGKEVKPREEIPINVVESAPTAGAPHIQSQNAKKRAKPSE